MSKSRLNAGTAELSIRLYLRRIVGIAEHFKNFDIKVNRRKGSSIITLAQADRAYAINPDKGEVVLHTWDTASRPARKTDFGYWTVTTKRSNPRRARLSKQQAATELKELHDRIFEWAVSEASQQILREQAKARVERAIDTHVCSDDCFR